MFRVHFLRNLRTTAYLLVIGTLLAAVAMLWWANATGLPASWRAAIENEVAKQGVHLRIGGFSYLPFQGVIARDVKVYSDMERSREISRLERVNLVFDKTKLARGIFRLSKVSLSSARLKLPVNPHDPDSTYLEATDVHGTILMPGGRLFEVHRARGKIAGIDVALGARILGYPQDGPQQPDDPEQDERRERLARILREIEHWDFTGDEPPLLRLYVEGDLMDLPNLSARLDFTAGRMAKNGYQLNDLAANGNLSGNVLTIHRLRARDEAGACHGSIDFNTAAREGRFDFSSHLSLPRMLASWFGIEPFEHFTVQGPQVIEAKGAFHLGEDDTPVVQAMGNVSLEEIVFHDVPFTHAESAFSWQGENLYLRDFHVRRTDGQATGKLLIEGPRVRLALQSDFPIKTYRPFFVGQPLEIVIDDFTPRDNARSELTLEGGFDLTEPHSWAYTGTGHVRNYNYNDVPVNEARCRFSVDHHFLDFFDGDLTFNYDDYRLKKLYNGPAEAGAKVGRIRYNHDPQTVTVENVEGSVWPEPLVHLFAPEIAKTLEPYRFHRPPDLKASGTVDVTPRKRTDLRVSFSTSSEADYDFLEKPLTLSQPRGLVRIHQDRVHVDELKFGLFSGPVSASFLHQDHTLKGELSWTKLSWPALARTYELAPQSHGEITGRVDFSCRNSEIGTLAGEGNLAIENAQLFSVPMFGPLSTLAAGLLGEKRAGFAHAKDAFFTYSIRDGILNSNDFHTSTGLLIFTGDGSVDLGRQTIDMTMRMNARGLLGIITLPFKPFYGLFQFRGTGDLRKPEWENVRFTEPPPSQNKVLQQSPKAKVIREN